MNERLKIHRAQLKVEKKSHQQQYKKQKKVNKKIFEKTKVFSANKHEHLQQTNKSTHTCIHICRYYVYCASDKQTNNSAKKTAVTVTATSTNRPIF